MAVITLKSDRTESFIKARLLADSMFELTKILSGIEAAVDSAELGDDSELRAVLFQMNELRLTISGDDPHQRIAIKPVTASGVLRVLDKFIAAIESRKIDSDEMMQEWGETYARFLTACEQMQASLHTERVDEDNRNVRSKSKTTIPTEVDEKSGIVLFRKASLVFTTELPIRNVKHLPPEFETVPYSDRAAAGYVMNNQTVLGLRADSPDTEKMARIINALEALVQLDNPMLNLLDNNRRKQPYFVMRKNPLVFAWLFPTSAYRRNPFKVVSVNFNISEEAEQFEPSAIKAKVKAERELFIAFRDGNTQYKAACAKLRAAEGNGGPVTKLKRELTALEQDLLESFRDEYAFGQV